MSFSSSAPMTLPDGGTALDARQERLGRQADAAYSLDQFADLRAQCVCLIVLHH